MVKAKQPGPKAGASRLLLGSHSPINKAMLGLVAALVFSVGAYVVTSSHAAGATWLSGASGPTAANGSFGTWRGEALGIVGTWQENSTSMGIFGSGSELGNWKGNADIAVGGLQSGESWANAANGAYDSRWRSQLTALKSRWAANGSDDTYFIRFAHEMNGNWYAWQVNSGNSASFITAWKRYRNLQKEIFPQGKLSFCLNRETTTGGDWRTTVPGYADGTAKQWIDVGCVDYYNQYPGTKSQAEFDSSIMATDGKGAPKGLEKHRQFWASLGIPMGLGEWNNNGGTGSEAAGDSPAFMTAMYNYFTKNAGTGAGNIWYEVMFNVQDAGQPQFWIYPNTKQPNAAAQYRALVWPSSNVAGGGTGGGGPTVTPIATPVPTPVSTPSTGMLPDLTVTNVSLSPAAPKSGDLVKFTAAVKNQGTGAIPAGTVIGVAFEVGTDKVWSDSFDTGLAAGATANLSANGGYAPNGDYIALVNGNYSVKVTVDDINRITESNETNNVATKPFTVGGAATTPTPTPVVTPTPIGSPTPTPTTGLQGDLNADGKVGALDLSILLSNWGKAGGDLNGDGTTGILDLSILISNWGK